MPQAMDHGYPVDAARQCEAKEKNSYRRCKKLALVDKHFCAYHSGLAGPRFDPFREIATSSIDSDICGLWRGGENQRTRAG